MAHVHDLLQHEASWNAERRRIASRTGPDSGTKYARLKLAELRKPCTSLWYQMVPGKVPYLMTVMRCTHPGYDFELLVLILDTPRVDADIVNGLIMDT